MSWNDERVETLKKLWAEGLSANQIAARIGGVSRNGVIGKVHRLGLAGRAVPHTRGGARAGSGAPRNEYRKRTVKQPKKQRPAGWRDSFNAPQPACAADGYTSTYQELDIPLAERKTLLDLVETSCRWPIGDPQHADFHFCNRTKIGSLPYCEHHARAAYQTPQPRRYPPQPAVRVDREKVNTKEFETV